MPIGDFISTSEIERETGFSNDLLRKWRQRFGFPLLTATPAGDSAYAKQTVTDLLLIKRLLESGLRPAQVVGKTYSELDRLYRAMINDEPDNVWSKTTQRLIERIINIDVVGFDSILAKERAKASLTEFVLGTVAPLMNAIGEAWSKMEIDIYHERLCTRTVQRLLTTEIALCKPQSGFPNILFSTPSDEHHELGLLMAEAVLSDHGARCFNLGTHTPLKDLRMAAEACKADVIALSFSFAYPTRKVRPLLVSLRHQLPDHIEIWVGGSGTGTLKRVPQGVRVFANLQGAIAVLHELALLQGCIKSKDGHK